MTSIILGVRFEREQDEGVGTANRGGQFVTVRKGGGVDGNYNY